MVKILTFYIITTRTVAMSLKGLFTLLLKQHDLFRIVHDTYEASKSKSSY